MKFTSIALVATASAIKTRCAPDADGNYYCGGFKANVYPCFSTDFTNK